ncbi:MAG: hypothetical protein C5B50_21815 [Verrucomicrobia bacterium]|nr:MAG: hypothetical protein C5B50_21815 [Verrucomicrobiota bacterium]
MVRKPKKSSAHVNSTPKPRLIKPVVARFRGFRAMEAADRAWWHALEPIERMRQLEFLRELNYGSQVTDRRLPRLPQVSQRPRR